MKRALTIFSLCILLLGAGSMACSAKIGDDKLCGEIWETEKCNKECESGYSKKISDALSGELVEYLVCGKTSSAEKKGLEYKLLESIPGFYAAGSSMSDLPGLILAIYKFGIWTVGIAGLFMLVIGGIMYAGSAGNTAAAGSAKNIITDALIGIAAAMGAYLFLYVINPDLTKINISFTKVQISEEPETSPESTGTLSAETEGVCHGLATQKGISSQCPAASPELVSLITCIAGKLPNAVINSITDSAGYANCTPGVFKKPPCQHSRYSCHYGGKSCYGSGKSYAVDLSTRNIGATQLMTVAAECGASYKKNEGHHVHASVGWNAGCGCN